MTFLFHVGRQWRGVADVPRSAVSSMLQTRITVILFTLGVCWANAAENAGEPDFARFPNTPAFRNVLAGQTNAAQYFKNVLAISAFCGNDLTVAKYVVTESGEQHDCRLVYYDVEASMISARGCRSNLLSEAKLKLLRAAISELPHENQAPPISRLVIVSFRDGTNWTTQTYDGDRLSKAMCDIYDVVGERYVTKRKRQ
jgi:hypothetical protein